MRNSQCGLENLCPWVPRAEVLHKTYGRLYLTANNWRIVDVAILGCGPTGLLAAHACAQEGVDFDVISKKRKSQLYGSQYLHEHIPGITNDRDFVGVKYVTRGTPEEYRRKVHGKWWDGQVAPEDFEPDHLAWNIRQAYDVLWQKYGRDVHDYEISAPQLGESLWRHFDKVFFDLSILDYDLVISTVPRTLWKIPGEEFIFSEGWALGDAPEEGRFIPHQVADNTIICDGTDGVAWTRLSKVFGYASVEWPHHSAKPPLPGVARVTKPLRYVPNSQAVNPTADWLHVGRYGQWEKGVVVTDAYNQVIKKLQEMK